MLAERLLQSTKFGGLMLIAQAVLERGQTNKHTDIQTRLNALPTPAATQPAWVIKVDVVSVFPHPLISRFCLAHEIHERKGM